MPLVRRFMKRCVALVVGKREVQPWTERVNVIPVNGTGTVAD